MNNYKRTIVAAVLLLCFGYSPAQAVAERSENSPLPFEEIVNFAQIFEAIKQRYIEPVSDEELLKNAIRGMFSGLDPHSAILSGQEVTDIRIDTAGKYTGLGIEITKEEGVIRVVSPIDDTPAHAAGIQPGDYIIRLDNRPVDRMSLTDAVNIMRGEPGTDITLTIVRRGVDQPFNVTLTRAEVQIKSVRNHLLEPHFGYLRISSFQGVTPSQAREQVSDLMQESDGLDGLIIDLRNNPGGGLKSAIELSDLFLDEGSIVSTRTRSGETDEEFRATPGDILNDRPLVILVNEGSASASEIVAGALQDHGRAIILGMQTFGKGSVQTILQINRTTAIKLTTHRYYTPENRSIQGQGITPDIVVERRQASSTEESENTNRTVRESDLDGALENEDSKIMEELDLENTVHPAVKNDNQLEQALNLLKGLKITRKIADS